MADKIVVMRDGHIQQVGTPLELYDWPANVLRRRFHRLAGDELPAGDGTGGRHACATGERRRTGAAVRGPNDTGDELLVGLRPEFGRLAAEGEGVPVDVLVIEPTGADTTLICRAGATGIAIVLRERTTLKVGERVKWLPALARAHLFDEQSGQRVADARQAH